MTSQVRAGRRRYLLVDKRKPHEPDITFFGIPVSTMDREELEATIYRLSRELERKDPLYTPGLDLNP